jgi:hypothetical protein
MKKLFTLLVIIATAFNLKADIINQLSQVNKQWLVENYHHQILKDLSIKDVNSIGAIKLHLQLVVKTLDSRPVENFSIKQINNRKQLLKKLATYADAGVFPINNNLIPCRNPIFIDEVGTHCAVGYLMQQSGYESLALAINNNERFAFIENIKTNGVKEWAYENGFSLAELAWIQPSYPLSTIVNEVSKGVDGVVNTICPLNNSTILIGGKFTKELANNVTCNNIALVTQSGFGWVISPLQNGVNDTVNIIYKNGNDVIVGGAFTQANGVTANHICILKPLSSAQMFAPMGSLNNTVNDIELYNGHIYAGGRFTDFLSKWNGTSWTGVSNGMIYGNAIHALHNYHGALIIGGDFELATGALRINVAQFNDTSGIYQMGFGTKQIIYDFETLNDSLYAAGNFIAGTDTTAVHIYREDTWGVGGWQDWHHEYQVGYIKDLNIINNKLAACGDFQINQLMSSGNHFGTLEKNFNITYISPIINTNFPVLTSCVIGNETIVGGTFTSHFGGTGNVALSRLAILSNLPNALTKQVLNKSNVFPNPATNYLSIEKFANKEFAIFTLDGKMVVEGVINQNKINIENLLAGIYFLRLDGNSIRFEKKEE